LCIADALPGREEYRDSEKYEVKHWNWDTPGNLKELIARVNRIRRENPALQTTWNLRFFDADNEYLLAYGKADPAKDNIILVVVNLDSAHKQSGWVTLPTADLDIAEGQSYLVHDLLSDERYIWHGDRNYVEIDPHAMPAQIFRIRKHMKRETDFDYYF
jgi:starch synthase (maltosyl-transferring)